MVMMLGTALTSLPHWWTNVLGSRRSSSDSNSAFNRAAGLNRPDASKFRLNRR